jgi:hypothetical protein
MVNQIRLSDPKAVPMALFALEVQRGSIPGALGELDKLNHPLAKYARNGRSVSAASSCQAQISTIAG